MKNYKFITIMAFLVGMASQAANAKTQVPRCWADEDSTLDDGVYMLRVPTAGRSAHDIAEVQLMTQGAFVSEAAVGTTTALDYIEFQFDASVTDWRASSGFPTLESLKQAKLDALAPFAKLPGVSLTCFKANHPRPHPSFGSNN